LQNFSHSDPVSSEDHTAISNQCLACQAFVLLLRRFNIVSVQAQRTKNKDPSTDEHLLADSEVGSLLRQRPVGINLSVFFTPPLEKDFMIISSRLLILLVFLALLTGAAWRKPPETRAATLSEPSLADIVNEAAKTALEKFKDKGLKDENLSITLIDLRNPQTPTQASFRGHERIYPASVVKLFYLVTTHRWLEDKKIEDTPELRRAMRDMIVDSSNEATQYIVDVLTHTTGGYELPPKEMAEWQEKRNAANRYFTSLGYTNINVNQKTFCEDAYGREKVSRGPNGENRNKLTTEATARLLAEIVTRKAVTPDRSNQMMELLKRDYSGTSKDNDDQAHGFTAIALQGVEGVRLWSKAGWTSTTRHDAAYLEMPDGGKYVLVTFTTEHANEREIIPTVARVVIERMKTVK
jgi:Beta-lactamase enzyme family